MQKTKLSLTLMQTWHQKTGNLSTQQACAIENKLRLKY